MGSGLHPREEQALPSLPLSAPSRQSLQRPGEARRRFQQRLLRLEPQFLPLLVWVLLPVLLLPVSVREGSSVRLLLPVLLTGLILQSLRALPAVSGGRLSRIVVRVHRALGFGAIAMLWLLLLVERNGPLRLLRFGSLVLVGLFALLASIKLVFLLARVPRVNASVMAGAAAGYIYLGLTGGLVAAALQVLLPSSFNLGAIGGHELLVDRLTYFSFVVLAGLGLGDVLPYNAIGERFVILLSLAGTLYQAVLMCLLIGRYLATQEAELELEAYADAAEGLERERDDP